ncbi:ubx domain-containing 7 [Hyphodiscus hymeniophilus]|uniref:Ubx domain-containing 7 n=1 Tax=Hyphodiscus hymeniophilus TaxID=353542 RepID=A0A9P6VMF3_9HELO|nr:ubx domain-containing 7 [Hyphodiscus hymeniophilus]
MFYNGDLQSGIAKAVQQSKLVACFVWGIFHHVPRKPRVLTMCPDDSEESKLWENDYLQDGTLKSSLSNQAVVLRLVAGSQEAGYLAAIYPLPKIPTLVIIKDGDLKEYIASGVTKEEFFRRLSVIFQISPSSGTSSSNAIAAVATRESQTVRPSQAPAPSADPVASRQPESTDIQAMLAERASRLEVDKKEKEAAEKAQRKAEAKARKAAQEEGPIDTQRSADRSYASMQKKRQQDARAERERILKRVEDDKAERRERDARRKAEAKAIADAEKEGREPVASSVRVPSMSANKTTHCALQIRLFDGSTIRSRFPSDGSLRADVRPWIDEQQAGDTPYTFKHVLSPLPNKNISISDEEQSLYSQGLAPSATLILVAVQGYTSAYEGSGGIVSRVASGGYGLVSSGVGLITGVFGSLLGGSGAAPTQERPADPALPTTSPAIDFRTLRDRDAQLRTKEG